MSSGGDGCLHPLGSSSHPKPEQTTNKHLLQAVWDRRIWCHGLHRKACHGEFRLISSRLPSRNPPLHECGCYLPGNPRQRYAHGSMQQAPSRAAPAVCEVQARTPPERLTPSCRSRWQTLRLESSGRPLGGTRWVRISAHIRANIG